MTLSDETMLPADPFTCVSDFFFQWTEQRTAWTTVQHKIRSQNKHRKMFIFTNREEVTQSPTDHNGVTTTDECIFH